MHGRPVQCLRERTFIFFSGLIDGLCWSVLSMTIEKARMKAVSGWLIFSSFCKTRSGWRQQCWH